MYVFRSFHLEAQPNSPSHWQPPKSSITSRLWSILSMAATFLRFRYVFHILHVSAVVLLSGTGVMLILEMLAWILWYCCIVALQCMPPATHAALVQLLCCSVCDLMARGATNVKLWVPAIYMQVLAASYCLVIWQVRANVVAVALDCSEKELFFQFGVNNWSAYVEQVKTRSLRPSLMVLCAA